MSKQATALLQYAFQYSTLLLAFLLMSNAVHADQHSVVIGTTEIPGQLTRHGQSNGEYDQLLAQLTDVTLIFAPYSRVERLFDRAEVDCLFPASTVTIPNKDELIESLPFTQSPAYLFSPYPYSDIQEFAGKTIAIRRGMSVGGIRETLPARYIDLDSEQALVQFLALRRADAFIAYLSDIETIYREAHRPLDFFAQDKPVYISHEAFVCRNSPRLMAFIVSVNEHIKRFARDND
ncbi:hypothetical protein [Alteromonas oceanisediminis]|uniref:hypothetical protein n=1 Tax=Alteromonas oceanisediminis TaxID=2836180 RepID=UPI001BDA533D|nr:hypothetical protein [Alteromonas oceanisediminis]MBT0587826.1 hypothetical protein [Alteromonas oceanisediminis]